MEEERREMESEVYRWGGRKGGRRGEKREWEADKQVGESSLPFLFSTVLFSLKLLFLSYFSSVLSYF